MITSAFRISTPSAIAPIASSGCHGTPSFRTTKTSSGRVQSPGNFVGHRHTPTREGQHDEVAAALIGDEALGQKLACLPAVAKTLLRHPKKGATDVP